ncbi:TIGR01777 family oxidoreductase [Actinoallomurus rhizosphaericola]|uniref:TIGR01777 family oxidoreductase n=1 Tax=Actinoallomurus rhizosphaericola TaxID=2952536 RepID=UPI00209399AF|nr:TIGR01777 family oxidoreductase [Actinoallomurus rhizosphaericola]MCO5996464.1 TIGR01777 family oxidoreductase [Actinoallomurus rhizosphaericola]
MQIAITGSTGLIGQALVRALRDEGLTVLRLVRRRPAADDEVRWDPFGEVDTASLEGVDVVVHLAGAGIGDRRWTDCYKQEIRDSRIEGTRTLCRALAALDDPPSLLVSSSAVGYYGCTGDRTVDEDSPPGEGFLADVCRDWEAATAPAAEAGIRVVIPRTGVVLAREGGTLGRMLPLFRAGLGGRLGSGRQWFSWITLADEVAALRFLIGGPLEGPVNLTAPEPVTNAAYTTALGRALHRPTPFAVPPFALRLALGGLADEGVLVSQRVLPARLTAAGFGFRYPDLASALAGILP